MNYRAAEAVTIVHYVDDDQRKKTLKSLTMVVCLSETTKNNTEIHNKNCAEFQLKFPRDCCLKTQKILASFYIFTK